MTEPRTVFECPEGRLTAHSDGVNESYTVFESRWYESTDKINRAIYAELDRVQQANAALQAELAGLRAAVDAAINILDPDMWRHEIVQLREQLIRLENKS